MYKKQKNKIPFILKEKMRINPFKYIYIFMCMCLRVCMYVCVIVYVYLCM